MTTAPGQQSVSFIFFLFFINKTCSNGNGFNLATENNVI